jgi:uncharacterized protein
VKQLRLSAAFLVVLLLVTMSFGIVGVQASEPKIPNPTAEFYYNDFAKVLDPSTGSDIVSLGESTFKSTDGGQVVFVSIDTLNGNTIEEYSNALFNKWKIGTEDKGILFILSMQERESRIEVGYGYEGVLTDIESNRLLIKFAKLNEEKGIDEAVKTIYSDIISIVNGDGDIVQYPDTSEARQQTGAENNFFSEHPIMTIIFAIIILILVILNFVLTGGRVTFFILRLAEASARSLQGGHSTALGSARIAPQSPFQPEVAS